MQLEQQRETLRNLSAFVVLARELNFTRAAATLGVSQSALSYTIKTMEQQLGVRLFIRTTRSVGLSEAGERLLNSAQVHLEGIEQALAAVREFRDHPAGTVRIATSNHAADTVLYPVLQKLLPQYPEVSVELIIDNGFTDIAAERCDAGVRLGEHLAHDMVAARIGADQRLAVAGSPSYFATHGRPQTPDDLIGHNCLAIRFETQGSIYSWEFEKDGKEVNVHPKGQITSNDPTQALNFCKSGIGLACLQESYFEDALTAGELETVLEDWCQPFTGYYLYYPSRRQPTAAFKIILNALRNSVRGQG
jgi:DNA-binding transcriptional LysR family regulator